MLILMVNDTLLMRELSLISAFIILRFIFVLYYSKNSYREKKKFRHSSLSGVMSRSPLFISKDNSGRGGWYRLVEVNSPVVLFQKYINIEKERPFVSDLVQIEKYRKVDSEVH